ncbi:MAG: 6-carboxytetrahydropterin synthase, partial [Candidatus Thorarchaeota archaeon]
VLDFKEVKRQTVNVCSQLDHKVLLPGKSDTVAVEEAGISYEVIVSGKRYVFPGEDCVIIPYSATTAELIAEYISSELRLSSDHRIKVCVSENAGSTGCYDTGVS